MSKYGYDIICPAPPDKSLDHDLMDDDTTINDVTVSEFISSPQNHYSQIVCRCRECGAVWKMAGSFYQLFPKCSPKIEDANYVCPSCGHIFILKAESTRLAGNTYTNGLIIKRSEGKISLGLATTEYTAMYRRKRISHAKIIKENLDCKVYFFHKGRYWEREQRLCVQKTQTFSWLTVSKTGIFKIRKLIIDGRHIKSKYNVPIMNISYNVTDLRQSLIHMRDQGSRSLPDKETGLNVLTTFKEEALRIISPSFDGHAPPDHEFAAFICNLFWEQRKPALKQIKFPLDMLQTFSYEGPVVNAANLKRDRARIVGINGQATPAQAIRAVLNVDVPKSIRRALASISDHPINWPLARIAVHGIKDPNFAAHFISTYCTYRDHRRTIDILYIQALTLLAKVVREACGPRAVVYLLSQLRAVQDEAHYQDAIAEARDCYSMLRSQMILAEETNIQQLAEIYREFPGRNKPDIQELHEWLIERIQRQRLNARNMNVEFKYTESQKKLASKHDDFEFVLPRNSEELISWGKIMHNCIQGYNDAVVTGRCLLFAVIDPNGKMVSNIEITRSMTGNGLGTRQVKGFCNRRLLEKSEEQNKRLNAAIESWLWAHQIALETT